MDSDAKDTVPKTFTVPTNCNLRNPGDELTYCPPRAIDKTVNTRRISAASGYACLICPLRDLLFEPPKESK